MQSQHAPSESTGQAAATAASAADSDDGPAAIRAEDVHVTYADGTEAISGVDLAVEPGECFGFLGPNGAGKSTTIQTLVSLLHPTRGSVTVHGHDVVEDAQAVREYVGYMPQETSVDPELTARENVRFAARIHGVPAAEREERVEELLDVVDLTTVADDLAETFSGGMAKRLDAANALVHRPPVVFLDEPTTGLDPEARMELWDYFEAINDAGTTVFLTTQYLEEVDRLCDRIALLQDGEVVATDTPAALKAAVGGDVLELTLAGVDDTLAEDRTGESGAAGSIDESGGVGGTELRDHAASVVRSANAFDDPTVERTDEGLAITADDVRTGVMELFVAFHDAGLTVTGVDVRSPTLDDVFLSLTGEQIDEAETATGSEPRSGADVEEVAR
ncbi:daunorubicin resistance ABC transporter ATP-binding protein [Salinarchaeum sp. Harcht-Bsk1]|uniref:ABC transporter ATP-binding protein n=1 Tax=Salinarchaeum sp. Harcht-Bsk1 TaxID=1333523 RepID=UPI0003424514|nr:ABC transporter ATP-binding protein [Salinarchaeum sp. Harcht-Bsk1]AGN01368.1 daunorubicin resistance ABC transporter ATP-binding protein [Salinarchaeum sp. Harcht-Bsk1]